VGSPRGSLVTRVPPLTFGGVSTPLRERAGRPPGSGTPGTRTPGRPQPSRQQPRSAGPRRPRPTYRRDIDGLRALAIVLVVAFHAGLGIVPGGFVGVDVFFVVSGFLITGLLVDEIEQTGALSLSAFYARRVRRLLPLSALVLVSVAFLAAVILPPLTHASVAADIRSAALWFSNWHFAAESTQYMADTEQSPVLHYWSLSVEEQFYVVWPLLLLLVLRSVRRWGPMARRRTATVLVAVLAVSFLLSVVLTVTAGPWAYFGLQTRAWELAVGATLALVVHRCAALTLPAASVLGWAGLGLILYAAFTLTRATPYPGVAAVLPVAGTALVIASGARTRGAGPGAPLSHPVSVYVGKLSYGWYLWHWPLLVFAGAIAGVGAASDGEGGGVDSTPYTYVFVAVVLSFVLAAVSHRVLEDPVRRSALLRSSTRLSLMVGAVLTAVSLVAASVALGGDDGTALPTTGAAPSLASTGGGPSSTPSASTSTKAATLLRLTESPAQARADQWPTTPCFAGFAATDAPSACRFGDPKGRTVIALVGDSHAAMWLPALDAAGKARHWQVWFWAKSSCPLTDVTVWLSSYRAKYDACSTWRTNVLARIAALPRVDEVVVARSKGYQQGLVVDSSGQPAPADAVPALWRDGTARTVAALRKHAAGVVLLRDTPWATGDVPDCLSAHLTDVSACAFPLAQQQHADQALVGAEATAVVGQAGVRILDPTSLVCRTATCSVVTPKGGVVFRDAHHLTRTYATSIAAPFARLVAPRT
jgi:peptidoglycan/LPS O-acetylase OafA/YrhL